MFRRLAIASILCALACGDDLPGRPLADQGPQIPDGSPGTPNDLDGDGLCNGTEELNGTDPLRADSDGDGYPDLQEQLFGYDALSSGSPARDEVHILRENDTSSVQAPFELAVTAAGEEYAGAFDPLPVIDLGGQDAGTFYRGSVATFADPPDNVAETDATGETFRGVVGRTRLGFEVFFEYGAAVNRACIRAYPFQYTIKRQDGVRLARYREIVLVLPVGDTLATGAWCPPEGGCI